MAGTVRELTHGGAEIAVEAVGTTSTLRQAFEALRPGGMAIAVGLSSVQRLKPLCRSMRSCSNRSTSLAASTGRRTPPWTSLACSSCTGRGSCHWNS